MILKTLRLAALAAALACPGSAAEISGGVGLDDFFGDPVAAAALEVRTDPLWSRPNFTAGLGAAAEIDTDFWAGAGPFFTAPFSPGWRLELSIMLGAYHDGGGNDLGSDFPIFRSQFGVSYALDADLRLGLAFNHKSNANTSVSNPGVETLFMTLARRF